MSAPLKHLPAALAGDPEARLYLAAALIRRVRRRRGLSRAEAGDLAFQDRFSDGGRAQLVEMIEAGDLARTEEFLARQPAVDRDVGPAAQAAALLLRHLDEPTLLDLSDDPAAAPAADPEAARYRNAASQTLLQVVVELSRRPLEPRTLASVTEALGEPRDRVYRSLRNLELAGWAEHLPAGGWRLAAAPVRIAERLRLALHDVHRSYLGE